MPFVYSVFIIFKATAFLTYLSRFSVLKVHLKKSQTRLNLTLYLSPFNDYA